MGTIQLLFGNFSRYMRMRNIWAPKSTNDTEMSCIIEATQLSNFYMTKLYCTEPTEEPKSTNDTKIICITAQASNEDFRKEKKLF